MQLVCTEKSPSTKLGRRMDAEKIEIWPQLIGERADAFCLVLLAQEAGSTQHSFLGRRSQRPTIIPPFLRVLRSRSLTTLPWPRFRIFAPLGYLFESVLRDCLTFDISACRHLAMPESCRKKVVFHQRYQ